MKIPPLEYPVQQKYTIPRLARYFYTISLVLLCFFTLLNVILVGSDVVTVTKTDPTALEDIWWMPNFWPKQLRPSLPQRCEPVSLTSDTPLRTNSTLSFFNYVLRRANAGRSDVDPSRRVYPAPYIANQLSGCEVGTIIWRMDLPEIIVSYKATVHCTLESRREFGQVKVPGNITLSVNHHRSFNRDLAPDDLIDYLAFDVDPESKSSGTGKLNQAKPILSSLATNSTSSINVLGVLDALQYDFSRAVWAQLVFARSNNTAVPGSGSYSPTYIAEWAAGPAGSAGCWSKAMQNYSESCGSMTDQQRMIRDYGTGDGPGWSVVEPNFIQPFSITRTNIFIALRDAILIDLGNADTQTNIYLNKTYFNQVIRVDPFQDEAKSSLLRLGTMTSEDWKYCSWWGCSNTTWAQEFRDAAEDNPVANLALPYKPNNPQSQVVFSFNYLCPTFQRKDISSLLTSIFVATATTLGVLNSLFGFVMPQVEEWYRRRKQAGPQAIGANMENRSDVYPIEIRPSRHNLNDDPDSESENGDYRKTFTPGR